MPAACSRPARIAGRWNRAGTAPRRAHCIAPPQSAPIVMAVALIPGLEGARRAAAAGMLNSLDLEGRPQDTRVVVAMSGGVDSSVTAALLKAEGYDVVGVTLQLYDHGAATHRKGACCAGQDIHDARAVADRIGIPHYVLDYESRFKEAVIDRFAESYVAGETPVPCVDCNMAIKFSDLLGTARELGAKVLATGHYVASRALPDGGRALYRAREEERDQSYFLFATTHAQLDLLRFPLGDMTKARDARAGAQLRPRGRRQARQPGHLLRADRPLHRRDRAAEARRRGGRRHRRSRRPRARPPRRHHPFHHRPAARPGDRRPREPLYVVALDAATRRVVVGPREALTHAAHRAARRQLDRRGRARPRARRRAASRCSSRCARRGRRSAALLSAARRRLSRSSWSTARTACRPARPACSTTAREGQARVLGGGFIRARGGDAADERRSHRQRRRSRRRWGRRSTATRSRRPMRAGRRSTTWCSARCSSSGRKAAIAAAEAHVGPAADASSKSASAPASRCLSYRAQQPHRRHRHSAPMLRKRAGARRRARADQRRGAGGDGRQASRASGRVVRRGGGAIRHHRGAGPGGDARRVRRACSSPAARSSWSITSAPRAGFRRAFEQGFSPMARRLGWSPEFPWARLTRLGRARRRAADRAPADAAARAFLADPLRQSGLTRLTHREPDRVPARFPWVTNGRRA